MSVEIHGKQYVTVAERVQMAHEQLKDKLSIQTELTTASEDGVMFKATVTTPKGTFVGHAYSSLKAQGIEGQSPIEVAETSAVGRALGFAGFGVIQGLATGDEIKKSESGYSRPTGDFARCSFPDCNKALPVKVVEYSKSHYGKLLCMVHQKSVEASGEVMTDQEQKVAEDATNASTEDLPF